MSATQGGLCLCQQRFVAAAARHPAAVVWDKAFLSIFVIHHHIKVACHLGPSEAGHALAR